MSNNQVEQYQAHEKELRKQLEEEKAKNNRLELEMQYKDKVTGLWNRKYIDKLVEEKQIDIADPNLAVICTGVQNLKTVNEKDGDNAGDELLRTIASELQTIFGEKAICCKLVGTKMCVFVSATAEELEKMVGAYDEFTLKTVAADGVIDISYGVIKLQEHPGKDVAALLKEAEYGMLMHTVSKENAGGNDQTAYPKPDKGQTILAIDDSMIILKTLRMMLEGDYKVLITTSGLEGYEIAKVKKPDLILLDYNMPVVDGERIMQLLKKSNSTKDIPVVFVSSVSERDKILKVARYKPAGYLLKPVEKDNLLWVVKNIFQSQK